MTVMVSDDGGLTFPRERALVVDASPSMYSNLADGGGGNVLLFYERAGHANTTRTSARPVNVDDRGKRTPNAADASPRNTRAVSHTGTERSQISAAASVTASLCQQPGWSTTFVDEFDGALNTTNWHVVEISRGAKT